MSLILEALKKSEAERRLGQAPDLLAPPIIPVTRRHRIGAFGLIGALFALGLAAWWWWPAPPVPGQAAEPAQAPIHARAASEAGIVEAQPGRAPVAPATGGQGVSETIANVPLVRDPEFSGVERESIATPAGAIPLPAAVPPRRDAARRADPAPSGTGLVAAGSDRAKPEPAPTLTVPRQPEAAAAAPIATAPAAEPLEALPLLAHMLPSEREGLPPLRLSMHVYAAEPGARVVLIDGRRYHQGDAIERDLVVDEIRPDGVALAYRGRRFLLGRP